MSIQKHEYELSVWSETLGDNGQKIEKKEYIIGAHDMSYLGRATGITFETKLNGTHTLTFQLPDRYFDSEKGDYVRNEFVDNLFNERKIKLYFLGEWYEFYIKSVSETKHFKSYMKKYTCSDAFIEELSRNGYGITFDTELYNNVEEIGTFSRIILEDSIWSYAPEHNWGDFTEYLEEKLFKVPVSLFSKLVGHKLTYQVVPREGELIINAFTQEKRGLELGDDLAAAVDGKGGYFWDAYDGTMPLMHNVIEDIPNDGYIYIPYSQLEFCYKTTSEEGYTATEEVCYYGDKSYAIAPATVDPTALIQFMAIPKGAEVEIDEAGLILNKDFTYVMTVQEWNDNLNSEYYYKFLPKTRKDVKTFTQHSGDLTYEEAAVGNKAAYYEGYLDRINDLEVLYGKKISVADRTEVNITDEIDLYVKVYNQKFDSEELIDLYTNPDDLWLDVDGINYRVCSKTDTRLIVPQLARNYLQNGTKIKTTDGWEPCKVYVSEDNDTYFYTNLQTRVGTTEVAPEPGQLLTDYVSKPKDTFLEVIPCLKSSADTLISGGAKIDTYISPVKTTDDFDYYNSIINFGIVGLEKKIIKDTIYCLGIKIGFSDVYTNPLKNFKLRIGEGRVVTSGEYDIVKDGQIILALEDLVELTSETEQIRVKTPDDREELSLTINIYEGYFFIKFNHNIDNPYFVITGGTATSSEDQRGEYDGLTYSRIITNDIPTYYLFNSYLFEAYTKGIDLFDTGAMYRYSGRELYDLAFIAHNDYEITEMFNKTNVHNKIIFEEDVMPGDTYSYQKYFIQLVIAYDVNEETGQRTGKVAVSDTFALKEILSDYADLIAFKKTNVSHHDLPYSAAQFGNDDLEIATKYIDLNKCKYYNKQSNINTPDCSYGGEHICLYLKYGYCPYLFETEKHCRKIRTLNGEKSNRFNLTLELSKVFEIYPIYWTEHYENGKIKTDTVECDEETKSLYGIDTYERMRKKLFYIREKGMENKLGFRYEKNLSSISRDIKSDQIVTKLYVSDVDSELSKTGLCSIKTAEDNPSKDSFIINFNYYTTKGILDKDMVDADLYGKGEGDLGYLKQLGYLNTEYDKLSNAIINLSNSSFNELLANVETNVKGIETALKLLFKLKKGIAMYESKGHGAATANKENQSYLNLITKYNEQLDILNNLIYETFFDQVTNEHLVISEEDNLHPTGSREDVTTFFDDEYDIKWMLESSWFKQHTYNVGMLGQFNREYLQIAEWKKKQSYYLKEINKLALKFFRKYEPYLKEGTWSDSNYLSDNAYYFGAVQVAADGSIPKVSYNISVVDLYALPEYEDYLFNIADTTYVEDIGMFGINPITGLPNRLKVIISGITYNLDEPLKNSISVLNFTTQFADLFQQVTASVLSLSFNENIYKRASNFTSNQNIDLESLLGTLDTNEMQLIDTDETNIQINKEGQSGSDINNHNNKYRLNGLGMEFSNNGGQTWNIGVGPGGINADYIKVGTLDAGKIRIVDNNYLYFLWDKNGISAFRDPQSLGTSEEQMLFDYYALFNRYGLSLVEKGLIRLRAGYNFNGAISGDNAGKMTTEKQQGREIGFYLYNDKGIPIFRTHTLSLDENGENLTARLSLKGEMYVSDADIYQEGSTGKQYVYTGAYRFSQITVTRLTDSFTMSSIDPDNWQEVTMTDYDTKAYADYLNYHILNNELTIAQVIEASTREELKIIANGQKYDVHVTRIDDCSVTSYLQNNEYHLNRVTGQRVYVEGLGSDIYFLNNNSIYHYDTTSIAYCANGMDTSAIEISTTLFHEAAKTGYIQSGGLSVLPLTTLSPFYYNNDSNYGFVNLQEQEVIIPATLGAVGLYINNKIALENQDQSGDQRLFCCAKNIEEANDATTNNIFTIKKDGSLYMGGILCDENGNNIVSSASVDDKVKVKDADIFIEKGIMYVAFDKIKDPVTGRSLVDALADVVAGIKLIRHRHEIKTIYGSFNSAGNFAYLPTEEDLEKIINLPGYSGQTLQQYLTSGSDFIEWNSRLAHLLELFSTGQTDLLGNNSSAQRMYFTNKVLVAEQEYTMNCVNTFTEYVGSGSEGEGGNVSIETYGILDPANAEVN